MSQLELRGVSKVYDPRTNPVAAVRDLDLDIERGEIVALLGSSGCGKTSTLRMIAGFEDLTDGALRIAGKDAARLLPARRNVAMAFEGYSLYPPLTVRENIGFALRSGGMAAGEIDRQVRAMAAMLEIGGILDRYPASVSGGQQQRASLARALVRDADLHLLDEPMGQLEPQLRALLRGRIKHFLKERGHTAILVTHDQTEANALADRIAVMEGGELQQYASPAALRDRPANLYTGTFIGEPPMNVIDATPLVDGARVRLVLGDGVELDYSSDDFSPAVIELLRARDALRLGIRPHAVRLGAGGARASVVVNQWLGDQSHVATAFAGATLVAVEHDRVRVAPGDTVAREPRAGRAAPVRRRERTRAGARARGGVNAAAPAGSAARGRDVLIGIDAGTSVIKAVAFTATGATLASVGRPNRYAAVAGGGVEQDMRRTLDDVLDALAELVAAHPTLARRTVGLAVTGQGDGTWLVDASGEPVHDAWLWLDARSAREAREISALPGYEAVYAATGTGVNVCQTRTHLHWLRRHAPELLRRAATALHCKDWLYLGLTGERATDPSEGVFTFGSMRTRDYSDEVIDALELGELRRLLPPIVDGTERAATLTATAAKRTGLPAGLPVTLGYVDVICAALGGGLYAADAAPGLSVVGSTGMHMRRVASADAVTLNAERSGYTMCFPGGGYAQMQSNMAATLNIDWLLDFAADAAAFAGATADRAALLPRLDAAVASVPPGTLLYHPYASRAGERGPFTDPDARAGFTGIDVDTRFAHVARAVYEGLALAARDCYDAMGELPDEIRLSGGAARSPVLRAILGAALDRPLRTVERDEAGAAGACMIAAVGLGLYPDVGACCAEWIDPLLGEPVRPDGELAAHCARLLPVYREVRESLGGPWAALAALRG